MGRPRAEGAGPGESGSRFRRPRVLLLVLLIATGLVVAIGAIVVAVRPQAGPPVRIDWESEPQTSASGPGTSPRGPWLSGAAGEGVSTGEFAEWRGRAVDIAATWVDNNDAMLEMWTLQPGAQYGNWDAALDVSIGAFTGEGENWHDAADGQYDDRWRESLQTLADLRADRPGTTFIRFAHEMNGDWFAWSVNEESNEDFIASWRRFRDLQKDIFPEAKLVFSANREAVGTGMDWREMFPGAEHVDVMGVDYYNQSPSVDSEEEWLESIEQTDGWGAPKGIEQHRRFAESVGLPLAVPEWSGSAREGDSPAFIRGMHSFFAENAGDGAGDLLYEIQFNVDRDDLNWVLFGEYTRMPKSAVEYRSLW